MRLQAKYRHILKLDSNRIEILVVLYSFSFFFYNGRHDFNGAENYSQIQTRFKSKIDEINFPQSIVLKFGLGWESEWARKPQLRARGRCEIGRKRPEDTSPKPKCVIKTPSSKKHIEPSRNR